MTRTVVSVACTAVRSVMVPPAQYVQSYKQKAYKGEPFFNVVANCPLRFQRMYVIGTFFSLANPFGLLDLLT